VACGGTVDKDYPRGRGGYAFEFGDEPALRRVFGGVRALQPPGGPLPASSPGGFREVAVAGFPKDSLEVTPDDRERLAATLKGAVASALDGLPDPRLGHARVLITHGTDTLIETARFLAVSELFSGPPWTHPTVVLTGARRPERFNNSDAPVNLGLAVGALHALPAGVYIAIDLQVFPHDRVRRTEEGHFLGAHGGILGWDAGAE